jgi:multidrug efflux system outer membrane protein
MRTLIVTLAGLVLLGGCAVGPSTGVSPLVDPVASPTDTARRATARAFLDSLTLAREAERQDSTPGTLWAPTALVVDSTRDLAWLEVLRDTQLVALVRTAVANNRDLQVARARVREYRARLGVARADLFPRIDLNGTVSTNKVTLGGSNPIEFDAVRATADLSWELDFWGRLRRQTEAASLDWRGREADVRATVLALVGDVATAYLELRELDENLNLTEQTLASRRATLDLARRRFAQGLISELDVRQFEAEVADPAARLADFATQQTEKENQLALLLGKPPGPIQRGQPLDEAVRTVMVPDSIPGDLIARRPDVVRAQRDWQAATARIGVAVGNRLPRITITGQYGTQRPDFQRLFGSSAEVYTAQAGISIPLFTGGKLENEQRAARARADQAKSQYEQTVLTALREASDALAGVRLNRDQIVAQATRAQALRRAYDLAEQRYRSGVSSYLEVLDSQRGLFNAELALRQVQRQYLVATVRLYRALGGSWTEAGGSAVGG